MSTCKRTIPASIRARISSTILDTDPRVGRCSDESSVSLSDSEPELHGGSGFSVVRAEYVLGKVRPFPTLKGVRNVCECGTPVTDSFLCRDCSRDFDAMLGDLGRWVPALDESRTRQVRFGGNGGRRSTATPLPWNEVASRAQRAVSEWRSDYGRGPATPEAYRALSVVHRLVETVIDRPADRTYAGPCSACSADLYAAAGSLAVVCEPCGLEYDIEPRREYLLGVVEDQLATATELARALTSLGRPVDSALVRKWAERGRIVAHGRNRRGHAVYRVGDVLDLVAS